MSGISSLFTFVDTKFKDKFEPNDYSIIYIDSNGKLTIAENITFARCMETGKDKDFAVFKGGCRVKTT